MKPRPAATLIQVHYHNRLGGVEKVIAAYARAFEALHPSDEHGNFVLCKNEKFHETSFEPAVVMGVAECDYREFTSKADFLKIKNILVKSLEKLLDDPVIKTPVFVIGHNITLGKNCALSAAFAQCVMKYASSKAIRFFSVIHDLAEEGRADCLRMIEAIRILGIDIDNQLYPSSKNIRYLTPNFRTAKLLKKAGFHARLLVNPVEGPVSLREEAILQKKELKKRLLLIAKKDGTHFDDGLPVLLYPCRSIARKNILEAILLTTFVCKANLLLGAPGHSPGDRELGEKMKALCARYRLPVVFNCGRAVKDTGSRFDFSKNMYSIADACLSTSLAEGFGYALYEPWLFNKALIGRKPLGFKFAAGVVCPGLCKSLPIPAPWVSLDALEATYHTSMHACYGHIPEVAQFFDPGRFSRSFKSYFVKNGFIDFGCLDAATQFTVLSDLLKSPAKVEEWKAVCGKQLSDLHEAFEKNMRSNNPSISMNKWRVAGKLSMDAFTKRLGRLLNSPHPCAKPRNDFGMIAREFCSFSKFRLLMTPGN